MVAATAVMPSSSGTPAATSAPNATMRMISVIGSERTSAFLKSSSNAFEIALSALASPNWPTNTCGFAFWAAAVAASVESTRASVTSSSPGISNVTSADRPSSESLPSLPLASGDSTLSTPLVASRRDTVSSTAAVNSASPILTEPLPWTRTCSSAESRKSAAAIALSAALDSPLP
jgi:hypothetical protein